MAGFLRRKNKQPVTTVNTVVRTQRQRRRQRKEGRHRCLLGTPLQRVRMTFPESYPCPCHLRRAAVVVVVVGRLRWRVAGTDEGVIVKLEGTNRVESSSLFRLGSQHLWRHLHFQVNRRTCFRAPPSALPEQPDRLGPRLRIRRSIALRVLGGVH